MGMGLFHTLTFKGMKGMCTGCETASRPSDGIRVDRLSIELRIRHAVFCLFSRQQR